MLTLLSSFEEWCDRQVFTPEAAADADLILRYLGMYPVPVAHLEPFAAAVKRLAHREHGR